ncbi:MAG TPA: hypothetical protein VKB08_03560 [Bradyrhizobium sp.]|jgi:hypothetical protein|nr:hypothetical protein [Bradyrhizobium sp.]
MSKFAVGEIVDSAADVQEGGTIVAVFPTIDGSFRYAVDTEGYGALQFFAEEKLVVHPSGARAH